MPKIKMPKSVAMGLEIIYQELEEVGRRIKDKHKKYAHPEVFTERNKEWDFEYVPALKLFRYLRTREKLVKIGELGWKDRQRIRKIAKIYYAYILKKCGLEESFKNKVKRQRFKLDENILAQLMGCKSVIGVKLKSLMERDNAIVSYTQIPLVMKMLFDCINKRMREDRTAIASSTTDLDTLSEVIEMMAADFYSHSESIEKTLMTSNLRVAGDVLKFLLRNLPHTLFTSKYVDAFYQLCKIEDEFDRFKAMRLLIFQLPDANRNVLAELLAILYKLSGISLRNRKMLTTLREIMTPILFELEDKDTRKDPVVVSPYELTQMMVLYAELLFFVPPFMKKALEEKKIKEGRVKVSESVVKVTAAQFNTFNWGIVIDSRSVAQDVLVSFFKEVQRTRPTKDVGSEICMTKSDNLEDFLKYHVLVETGGLVNGERKLHEETPIVRVVRENPEVKWIVQCTHPIRTMNKVGVFFMNIMPKTKLPKSVRAMGVKGLKELDKFGKRIQDTHKNTSILKFLMNEIKYGILSMYPLRNDEIPVSIGELGLKDRERVRKMAQIYNAYIIKKYGFAESFKNQAKTRWAKRVAKCEK